MKSENYDTTKSIRLKHLVDYIQEHCSEKDQDYLFSIIRQETDNYTINQNGVFIDVSCLSEELVQKMEEIVYYKKSSS